jgi:hypothetical protein
MSATHPAGATETNSSRGLWAFAAILLATMAQLAAATFLDLERFEGKAFGSRLVAYPLMMVAPLGIWWFVTRRRRPPIPWIGIALIGMPFLIDVTGNSFDLYDTVVWWDDANHFVNWIFLSLGVGLLLNQEAIARRWTWVVLIAGIGALLAIGWELGEWFAFIRHGTELDTAYEDTLGDLALGTTGAFVAGIIMAARR